MLNMIPLVHSRSSCVNTISVRVVFLFVFVQSDSSAFDYHSTLVACDPLIVCGLALSRMSYVLLLVLFMGFLNSILQHSKDVRLYAPPLSKEDMSHT
jgi:hypothetical protein